MGERGQWFDGWTFTSVSVEPLTTMFTFMAMFTLEFQGKGGLLYLHRAGGVCNVHSQRFDPSATPSQLPEGQYVYGPKNYPLPASLFVCVWHH